MVERSLLLAIAGGKTRKREENHGGPAAHVEDRTTSALAVPEVATQHRTTTVVFPTLQAYLAELPSGLDSFPKHLAKASLLRTALSLHDFDDEHLQALPRRLQYLVVKTPTSNRWISEVEYTALSLALADAHGWSDGDFARFWYDVTKSLMASVLYAGLLGFLTPKLLLRSAALRWASFHKGVELSTRLAPGGLQLILTFPEGLIPPICTQAYASVFQATVDVSSSRTTTELVEDTPTRAVYLMRE